MRIDTVLLAGVLFSGMACTQNVEGPQRDPVCTTTIESTYPTAGATNFYYRDAIEFYLSDADPTAVIVTDIVGEQYFSEDGTTILFVPDLPLEPLTEYEVGLDYCHGTPSISFTTSELGGDIVSLDELEGKTYLFNLEHARYSAGGEVAEALLAIFNKDILIQILEATQESIALRGAVGESIDGQAAQDICYRTLDLSDLGIASADFTYEDAELVIDFYETELSFLDLWLSGTFAPDASWIGGVSFIAKVDVRALSETLGMGDADDICIYSGELGAGCQPCSSDGESYCIEIAAEKLSATAVDLELQKIEVNNSFEECVEEEE